MELYVERLDDGEVSPYLADDVEVGDKIEVRGPIGGWFVWDATFPGVGIGGGSGVVPLVAMLRHASHVGRTDLLRVVVAARTRAQLPYVDELAEAGAWIALSRQDQELRPAGRLTGGELVPVVTVGAAYYVCGSSGFAEAASVLLMGVGVPTAARTGGTVRPLRVVMNQTEAPPEGRGPGLAQPVSASGGRHPAGHLGWSRTP